MRRIGLVVVLALSFTLAPLAARAQPAAKVYRIGWLSDGVRLEHGLQEEVTRGLAELGYTEGKNVLIERRNAEGKFERLPKLARELVALKVDLIVTFGGVPATRAAKAATASIPIVMAEAGDPVGTGLVASLARPGGNVTGLSTMAPDITRKKLQLLREVAPKDFTRRDALPSVVRSDSLERPRGGGCCTGVGIDGAANRDGCIPDDGCRIRRYRARGGRCPAHVWRSFRIEASARDRGLRGRESASRDLQLKGIRRRRRSLGLWDELPSDVPSCGQLRGQDSQRRQARRSPHRAADQVRAGDQPQERQGVRPDDPADVAVAADQIIE